MTILPAGPGKSRRLNGQKNPGNLLKADTVTGMSRRLMTALGTVLSAIVVLIASAIPAWAADNITLTWVRHAQSTDNAAGIVGTTVPGPNITALGVQQAQVIAQTLRFGGYDGIFVSDMVRTSQTAAPLAADLGITPTVLGGLREINAGWLEGQSGAAALLYVLPPALWTLGLRFIPIPGGENGNGFEARVNEAVATIYDTGDTNPVIFSHGATIMAWTLMNVDNPNLSLFFTNPLGNTDVVVMNGNPEDGWTLDSWAGIPIDPNPGLLTRLFVDFRALIVAPQTSLYNIGQALRTGDMNTIVAAVQAGVVSVVNAGVEFGQNVVRDVTGAITGALTPSPAPSLQAAKAVAQPVTRPVSSAPAARATAPAPAAVTGSGERAERGARLSAASRTAPSASAAKPNRPASAAARSTGARGAQRPAA